MREGEQRVCRICGAKYDHPAPASLATKRLCGDCTQLPEAIRRVLEGHQTELTRLRRELERLKGGAPARAAGGKENPA
jgi:hypothetical protein